MSEPEPRNAAPEPEAAEPEVPADVLILLPVRNTVLFPSMIAPLSFGRRRSVAAVQSAVRGERPIGVIQQRDESVEAPGSGDLHELGTVATVLRYVTAPDGSHHVICQGSERFRVVEMLDDYPFLAARVERLPDDDAMTPALEARATHLRGQADELIELMPKLPQEVAAALRGVAGPRALADMLAHFLGVRPEEKQQVLETVDIETRVARVADMLAHRLAVLRLSNEIDQQTRETVDKTQREYLLREQLRTIRRELGEGGSDDAGVEELRAAVERAGMPEEAGEQARRELERLARMPESAAEYGMTRAYLDWLTSMPWSAMDEESIDIARARQILDDDHFGLEKVKRRILEYLAVRKLNPRGRGPILCLVGPPGVGKTSLGQSVARATGRRFARVALGGTHDESEIRGHRRTYVGALPGNVVQGLRKAGTRNPVFMLDEMDKVGTGFHGDPAAALLEVLDPEQNSTFRDNYLAVPFDLSAVMFIGTANPTDTTPTALLDRMEVIELPGYTEDEKLEIARRYLVGRQVEANGLTPEQATFTEEALRTLIRDYTHEAGCRNLERENGAVLRNVAMAVAEGMRQHAELGVDEVRRILGAPRYQSEVAMRLSVPGVATGLAWTPAGGDILFVGASRVPGKGGLILTGQLGDVMKECAQAALSLVKSRAESLDLNAELFERSDIHVHVPAGAIPKDGPSAGVALFTALVSVLTGRTVRGDIAMTGEISLRGLVLPVGGVKEKTVAAARAGIGTVLLPARNRRDFDDIPESARQRLEFVWLESVDDALKAVFDHNFE